jgi:hypothetical protein
VLANDRFEREQAHLVFNLLLVNGFAIAHGKSSKAPYQLSKSPTTDQF